MTSSKQPESNPDSVPALTYPRIQNDSKYPKTQIYTNHTTRSLSISSYPSTVMLCKNISILPRTALRQAAPKGRSISDLSNVTLHPYTSSAAFPQITIHTITKTPYHSQTFSEPKHTLVGSGLERVRERLLTCRVYRVLLNYILKPHTNFDK